MSFSLINQNWQPAHSSLNYQDSNELEENTHSEDFYLRKAEVIKTSHLPLTLAKIIGLLKDQWFTFGTLISQRQQSVNYGKVIGDPQKAKALVVLIHGLNAHPSQMDCHAKAFKKKLGDDVLIYQAQVYKKGNCGSRDLARYHISNTVFHYLKNSPNMKLYLHGISNGGLIAAEVAVDMIESKIDGNRIMVNANSSPFYGTKLMCDPEKASWKQKIRKNVIFLAGRHHEDVIENFTYGSKKFAKKIIPAIQSAQAKGVSFQFDGSFADFKVTPPSFYPKVEGAKYFHPKTIQGHSSIIASQRARQVNDAYNFINGSK